MLKVQLTVLKKSFQVFTKSGDFASLLADVRMLMERYSAVSPTPGAAGTPVSSLTRGDLRLVCFDFVSS